MTSERGRTYRKLSTLDQLVSVRLAGPMDVCLVTSELVGPAGAGGIGTASTALTKQLVAEGHRVTVLFTQVWGNQPYSGTSSWSNWVEQYRKLGITLHHIAHPGDYADWQAKSWLVMEFLRTNSFDLVYFNEHHASGYYALCAKRARLAPFVNQTYCVITHGSMEWVLRHNDQYMHRASDLLMVGMERRCVEWADFVLSPSEYLLQEYARYGWRIPDRAYVHPYPLIREAIPVSEESVPVDELVFMGRLETRKGLWLFCDALEQIAESLRGKTVTFMGRFAEVGGVSVGPLLVARARSWPFTVRFATWFSTREALEYLQRPGKLAVMPSLADNSPCVVYECLEKRIPFVSTLGSGAEELVSANTRSAVLVKPTAAALAEKLAEALRHGAKRGALAFDPEQSLQTWRSWHSWIATERNAKRNVEGSSSAATAQGDQRVLLNVMIDDGSTAVATLLANLRAQLQCLGNTAGHLVLTSRGTAFRDCLADLLDDLARPGDPPVLVLGAEDAEQARDILLDADVAFFSAAECEVELAFYLRAAALLTAGTASAVSCFVAQVAADGSLQLPQSELPCGDLPAAAAVQAPLASPVWAVLIPAVRDQLEDLAIHDPTFGQFLSSETLGQRLIHRCTLARQDYLLLPMVAARRTGPKRRDATHWYRDLGAIANDLGFNTQIYPEAAPWFAMASLGNLALANDGQPTAALPQRLAQHLTTDLSLPVPDRVRRLARRIGRPFLAAHLSVANGASQGLVDELSPAAASEELQGGRIDLLEALLGAGDALTAGTRARGDHWMVSGTRSGASVAEAEASQPGHFVALQSGSGPLGALLGKGLFVQRIDQSLICRRVGRGRARLLFVDLPLEGQEQLTIVTCATEAPAVAWELSIVDQLQGTVVAKRSLRSAPGERLRTTVPLPKMLGVLTISIELAKNNLAGLKIESLRVA